MTETASERISYLTAAAEGRAERTAHQLAAYARSLADQLAAVATALSDAPLTASYNTIGVVQGRGANIDMLCGQLAAEKQALADLKYLAEKIAEEDAEA